MSKRLCVCGLLLVLLAASPAVAQLAQAEEASTTTQVLNTLLPDWLEGLLSVVASGSTTLPVAIEAAPKVPSCDLSSPTDSFSEEEDSSTESGPGMEPDG